MIDKIRCEKRIGNDIHKELIALFKQLQTGWKPPLHISEEEYNAVRLCKENYPDYYVGLVGFNATFGSKYFGGYARGYKADKITPRDIPNEAIRNLIEQTTNINNVKFTCKDYLGFDESKIKNCVIYCDPPYQDTTKYVTGGFEYDVFWQWVRDVSKENYVLVSEYNAPSDFDCIWQKNVTTSLKVKEHEKRTEKLFVHNKGRYANQYIKD